MQSRLPVHRSPRCGAAGEPVPLARDGERPLPDARRAVTGRAQGYQARP